MKYLGNTWELALRNLEDEIFGKYWIMNFSNIARGTTDSGIVGVTLIYLINLQNKTPYLHYVP